MGAENSNQTDKPRFVGSQVKLEKLCSKGKSSLRQKDLLNDGPYPVYGASGVIGTMSTYQNDAPCVCVVKDGAGVGHAMKCRARSSVLGTMQALVPSEGINCDYLLHLVRSLKLGEGFTGSTIPHIYFRDYGKRLVPVFPYEQQIAIASMLNGIEALVDQRELMLRKCDSLVKSRFVEMFGAFDLSLQKSAWYPIKQLGQVVSGATPKTSIGKYWDGGIKWITPAELSDMSGWVYDSTRHITEEGLNSCGARMMPVGTVILSSRAPIGKMALLGDSMCCNQGFKNIVCGDRIIPEYLYYLLGFNAAYLNSLGRGATFKELSKRSVEETKIPVPPIKAQGEFVAFTQQVDKLRFAIQEQIKKLETLKASLMQEYFG